MKKVKNKNAQAGFTLVELAIVMIIIGLLIGGILKGQELVANAQVTATVAQIKGIDGALSTFRDKYSALPGDILAPNTRLRDCAVAPCSEPGDGNNRIDTPALGTAPTNTSEGSVAFVHMAAADLIAGVRINDDTTPPVFGGALPEAELSGGFWIGHTQNGDGAGLSGLRPGHYLVFNGTVGDVTATSETGITATQAAQIDRKVDDGDPTTGDVQSTGARCVATGIYAESDVTASCSLLIRVQS